MLNPSADDQLGHYFCEKPMCVSKGVGPEHCVSLTTRLQTHTLSRKPHHILFQHIHRDHPSLHHQDAIQPGHYRVLCRHFHAVGNPECPRPANRQRYASPSRQGVVYRELTEPHSSSKSGGRLLRARPTRCKVFPVSSGAAKRAARRRPTRYQVFWVSLAAARVTARPTRYLVFWDSSEVVREAPRHRSKMPGPSAAPLKEVEAAQAMTGGAMASSRP